MQMDSGDPRLPLFVREADTRLNFTELGLSEGGGERYKLWKQLILETMKCEIVERRRALP